MWTVFWSHIWELYGFYVSCISVGKEKREKKYLEGSPAVFFVCTWINLFWCWCVFCVIAIKFFLLFFFRIFTPEKKKNKEILFSIYLICLFFFFWVFRCQTLGLGSSVLIDQSLLSISNAFCFICLSIHSFVRSLICSFVCLFHSFIQSFARFFFKPTFRLICSH